MSMFQLSRRKASYFRKRIKRKKEIDDGEALASFYYVKAGPDIYFLFLVSLHFSLNFSLLSCSGAITSLAI